MARFSGDFPKNYDVFQASGGHQQEPEIQAWRAFPWVSLRKVHKNMVASISLGTFAIKLCTFRLSAGHRRSFIHSLASAKRSASPGGHQGDGGWRQGLRQDVAKSCRGGQELHFSLACPSADGVRGRHSGRAKGHFSERNLSIRIDKNSAFYGQKR